MQPNISNIYSRDRQFKGSRAGGKIHYSKGALTFHIFKFLKHQSKNVLTCPGVSSLAALSFVSISSPPPKPSYTTVQIWSTRQLKLSLPPPHLILVAQIHILQIIKLLLIFWIPQSDWCDYDIFLGFYIPVLLQDVKRYYWHRWLDTVFN